ncbi:MAG: thiamine diphosphokinase [Synergistes sp.]|nr:thiamine diphosphokinase [Synergistes sp.]
MQKTCLPHVTIECKGEKAQSSALFVLGGREPDAAWFAEAAAGREVWAADRGVEVCRKAGVLPDMLVGDCDSASRESWEWAAEHMVPCERFQSDKDLTDFQLAVNIFCERNRNAAKSIILTGAWGGRFDHLWSIVISFMNFPAPHVPFCIADEREGLVLLSGPEEMTFSFDGKPKALSLISFSEKCCGVSINGVRWPLEGAELSRDFPYAVSNRPSDSSCVSVSCESGCLGFCWVWNE